MSTEFAVRPLHEDDLPRILDLCCADMPNVLAGMTIINPIPNVLNANGEKQEAWIVEAAGRFVGLAMVFVERGSILHLNLVCVAPDAAQRRQIVRALVDAVLRHAWESDCLKLVVHTSLTAGRFLNVMHAFGFDFSRERWVGDGHIIEFYRNLYQRPEACDEPRAHNGKDHDYFRQP